jgi:hypothetical protein
VLLNGWKEIARYLKVGIRTAQRWHDELHLPVMRVRNSARGPVMAESQKLDDWLRRRSSLVHLSERTSALLQKTTEEARDFLRTELATGRQFATLAAKSTTPDAVARRTQAARRAYDTIRRLLPRTLALPRDEQQQLRKGLRDLKRDLEKLGDKV